MNKEMITQILSVPKTVFSEKTELYSSKVDSLELR